MARGETMRMMETRRDDENGKRQRENKRSVDRALRERDDSVATSCRRRPMAPPTLLLLLLLLLSSAKSHIMKHVNRGSFQFKLELIKVDERGALPARPAPTQRHPQRHPRRSSAPSGELPKRVYLKGREGEVGWLGGATAGMIELKTSE